MLSGSGMDFHFGMCSGLTIDVVNFGFKVDYT